MDGVLAEFEKLDRLSNQRGDTCGAETYDPRVESVLESVESRSTLF